MLDDVLSPCSVLLVMRQKKRIHTVQIGRSIYSCLEFYFLMLNGCALYKSWQLIVLEELPLFFFCLFTNYVPAFTNLLELSFGPVVSSTRAPVICIVLSSNF